ncbi:hypothetical protein C8F04DRAFT_719722 [Mycena alexandri]|uniref:Uncharacterized protein n=1 Tax=Mycena alexandri TaxID=1745969 RepID=A0AAD6TDR2_9AGAR|nr:hypothetical protein C8F04DRAFT_719722 [Mycena alexandri]
MLASLAVRGDPSESEGETDEEDESMPPLERINDGSTWHWPLPSMFDSDSDTDTTEMPALASVSNSSDSDQSDEEDESDSGAEEPEDHPNGRMTNIRPFDLVFEPGTEHPDAVMFERLSRLSSLWREAAVQDAEIPVAESSTRAANTVEDPAMPEDEEEVGDESEMPPLLEPPFVTDGRGRVVWSSSSDSPTPRASPSGPSTPAAPVPVEKPPSPRQAVGEGGFTTDGRGRVIGTTGVRENENENEEDDEAEESSSDSEAPAQSRSFLGRVLGAFF